MAALRAKYDATTRLLAAQCDTIERLHAEVDALRRARPGMPTDDEAPGDGKTTLCLGAPYASEVLAERRGRRRLRRVRGEASSREAPREDAGACFRPTHPRSFPTASLALVPSETRSSPPPPGARL